LGGAFGLPRLMEGLLFDVSPTDPVTLAVTTLVLLAVAVVASATRAWRAAGVDPARILNAE